MNDLKVRGGGVIYVLEEWLKSHDVLSWSDQDFPGSLMSSVTTFPPGTKNI